MVRSSTAILLVTTIGPISPETVINDGATAITFKWWRGRPTVVRREEDRINFVKRVQRWSFFPVKGKIAHQLETATLNVRTAYSGPKSLKPRLSARDGEKIR